MTPEAITTRECRAVPEEPPLSQRYPFLTWATCVICIGVFIGLNHEPAPGSWESLSKWGCYPDEEIREGAVWVFITSTFAHVQFLHLAFNLYWLYLFGTCIERVMGSARWLAFFLGAAFVSSGVEFAVTDSTGIGASGVVYAIFGFMWLTRRRHPSFEAVLDARTIGLFLLWVVGCLAMTLSKFWETGNPAHISGLLFGVGLGAWARFERTRGLINIGIATLFIVSTVPLFWAPWSFNWTSWHGMRAHDLGDYRTAIRWYERSLNLGEDKSWCWQNLALAYHSLGDQTRYQQTLQLLRKVDEKAAREVEAEVRCAFRSIRTPVPIHFGQ